MQDTFMITVQAEIEKQTKLSDEAMKTYNALKDKNSAFARSVLGCAELHNDIYAVCMQAKSRYERNRAPSPRR